MTNSSSSDEPAAVHDGDGPRPNLAAPPLRLTLPTPFSAPAAVVHFRRTLLLSHVPTTGLPMRPPGTACTVSTVLILLSNGTPLNLSGSVPHVRSHHLCVHSALSTPHIGAGPSTTWSEDGDGDAGSEAGMPKAVHFPVSDQARVLFKRSTCPPLSPSTLRPESESESETIPGVHWVSASFPASTSTYASVSTSASASATTSTSTSASSAASASAASAPGRVPSRVYTSRVPHQKRRTKPEHGWRHALGAPDIGCAPSMVLLKGAGTGRSCEHPYII
ncbi:hypothetical protein DFH07DRAFT_950594 [Mycena maculata]|uniref:Uncharacterized protein n=1 Tax=Mycena maculata TaxID=230809 RepID=A0AAD7K542_9AGAR|nr:hypothetical protein DFH07DRAFT_950594 [Mycena maculata]